jgi:hypothetical protein
MIPPSTELTSVPKSAEAVGALISSVPPTIVIVAGVAANVGPAMLRVSRPNTETVNRRRKETERCLGMTKPLSHCEVASSLGGRGIALACSVSEPGVPSGVVQLLSAPRPPSVNLLSAATNPQWLVSGKLVS